MEILYPILFLAGCVGILFMGNFISRRHFVLGIFVGAVGVFGMALMIAVVSAPEWGQ
jgi:hypothetical protein